MIGVHTPEFGFEHNLANVGWALQEMRVGYPVAVDSNYEIWTCLLETEYWPAEYFVDGQGRIRHHHFGEGAYDVNRNVSFKSCSPKADIRGGR